MMQNEGMQHPNACIYRIYQRLKAIACRHRGMLLKAVCSQNSIATNRKTDILTGLRHYSTNIEHSLF